MKITIAQSRISATMAEKRKMRLKLVDGKCGVPDDRYYQILVPEDEAHLMAGMSWLQILQRWDPLAEATAEYRLERFREWYAQDHVGPAIARHDEWEQDGERVMELRYAIANTARVAIVAGAAAAISENLAEKSARRAVMVEAFPSIGKDEFFWTGPLAL